MNIFLFYNSFILDKPNGISHQIRSLIKEAIIGNNNVVCVESGVPDMVADTEHLRSSSGCFVKKTERFNEQKILSGGFLNSEDIVLVHAEVQPHVLQTLIKAKRKRPFLLLLHDRQGKFSGDPFLCRDISEYVDGVLHRGEVKERRGLPFLYWEEAVDDKIFYPRLNTKKEFDFCVMANRSREQALKIQTVLDKLCSSHDVVSLGEGQLKDPERGYVHLGWQENLRLPEIMNSASVFLDIPPNHKPHQIRLPVLEAGACGLPVISLHESPVLEKGKDYLFAKDIDEMIVLAKEAISSTVLREFLSRNIQRKINRHFTSKQRFKEFENFIASLRTSASLSGGSGSMPLAQNIQGRSPVS